MNRPCTTCGAEFSPSRAWSKYCSARCRDNSPQKKQNTRRFQADRRNLINQIKLEKGCLYCGFNAHPAALEFNHRDRSTKLFNISQDPKRAWGDVLTEIDKCDVLCSNCHHIHSYENKHNAPRVRR